MRFDQIQSDWNKVNSEQPITVEKYLGKGSFGTVIIVKYKTEQCALKCIFKGTHESMKLSQFENELKALKTFSGNIYFPTLYGYGSTQHACYLLMPLYDRDLMDFILNIREEHKSSYREAVEKYKSRLRKYAKAILLGIEHMHSRKILHRDLKLENIVLAGNSVKIIDFGSSVTNMSDDVIDSKPITIKYTAPEIYENCKCDKPADLWSLGVIMYCMFEGVFPFDGEDEIVNDGFAPSYQYWQDETTRNVVNKLLNKNPAQRLTVEDAKKEPFFGFDGSDYEKYWFGFDGSDYEKYWKDDQQHGQKRTSQSHSHRSAKKRKTSTK